MPAAVVVNKVDLDPGAALGEPVPHGRVCGLPDQRVKSGTGLERTSRPPLPGVPRSSPGPPGPAKSSLLNAIQPGLSLRVAEVSEKIGRGRQTTVCAVMIPLDVGGFLVDTPGFSEVGLWGARAAGAGQLLSRDAAFPRPVPLPRLLAPDRTRMRRAAGGGGGKIAADRWESYRKLLARADERAAEWE